MSWTGSIFFFITLNVLTLILSIPSPPFPHALLRLKIQHTHLKASPNPIASWLGKALVVAPMWALGKHLHHVTVVSLRLTSFSFLTGGHSADPGAGPCVCLTPFLSQPCIS